MAEERTYNIPLRKEWLKVPIYKRASKSVRAVKQFIKKHTKSEDIRIGRYLNQELWSRGNRHPPPKVSVTTKLVEEKDKKYVQVELVGAPEEKPKEEKKEKAKEEKKEAKEEKKEEKPKKETKKTVKKS
ncbi:MAG: 50S ribosomal protein L31e [Nanoarchaeota archaeon]|nr:50S ribosomal protein L31e [Nanoarchaeota archaeon]